MADKAETVKKLTDRIEKIVLDVDGGFRDDARGQELQSLCNGLRSTIGMGASYLEISVLEELLDKYFSSRKHHDNLKAIRSQILVSLSDINERLDLHE